MSDPRFVRLRTDPRFRRLKKSKQKIVVDDRFKAIFEDDTSKISKKKSKSGRVDKYGRQLSDTHEKDDLRRFYRLEGEGEDEDPDTQTEQNKKDQTPAVVDYARGQVLLESSDEEEVDDDEGVKDDQESSDDGGQVVLGRHASKPIPVLAEDDDYLEVDLNEEEDEDVYADLDAQAAAYAEEHANGGEAEQSGTRTNRIAVVNLDWDHVRASHLYKIFSSLVSPTAPLASVVANAANTTTSVSVNGKASTAAKVVRGKVLSVRVYPSEFGKERLKREDAEGPPKEIFKKSRRYDEDDTLGNLIQEDEGDPYDEKALRKYQLERLRYYYAIATCDTIDAAAHIFSELDGTELERSANVFDLSFVPDDMTFDDDFRDEATPTTEASTTTYKPLDFSTAALRHSKVTFKWDEDDPERDKVTRRALSRKEIEEGDYRAYIASSSSEGESEEHEFNFKSGEKKKSEREKLRDLLLGGGGSDDLPNADAFGDDDKGSEGDMEITFLPGLSEANAKASEETTIEAYRRKQKEKRLARKKDKTEKTADRKDEDVKKKKKKPVDDDFFAAASDSESDEDTVDDRTTSKSKSKRKDSSEPSTEHRPATEEELQLLVAPDDVSVTRDHFDMKAILKAEKAKGKKRGKKGKKNGAENKEDEIQEDFHIDVKDERFKALHEDHTFAIDPSNPHFKKSKSMAALLEERAKRQSGKDVDSEHRTSELSQAPTTQSLQSLVESVKRKSSRDEGKGVGKRRRL